MSKINVLAWVSVSDLVPIKKTKTEGIIDFVFGEKPIYKSQPIEKIFNQLKNSGVDGLELLVPLLSSDKDLTKVKNIVTKSKIPVMSIHQSLTSLLSISLSEIERLCKIANLFSAKVVVLHSSAVDTKIFDQSFIEKLKLLQKRYRITFGIENVQKTGYSFGKGFTYKEDQFATAVQKAGLSMTLDTTHLAQTGGDIIQFYKSNKEQIVNIHLSDFKKNLTNTYLLLQTEMHMPLLEGELPVRKFLKLLKATRYAGLITMEIFSSLEQICASAKTIKSQL